MEFTQVLQDMIGDLSNAPEPIQIKLFCNDQKLHGRYELGPAIGRSDQQGERRCGRVQNGVDNTISGPATNFQVDPVLAARMGFTPTEVAEDATSILDGVTPNDPLIANGRPYTIRVRLGDDTRQSLDTIKNTVFNSATGHTATLGSMTEISQLPPQNEIHRENLQQEVVVTGRLEGADLGTGVAQVQKVIDGMHLPPNVRVEYGGTYQEQQKSFADLLRVAVVGAGAGVWRAADGVPKPVGAGGDFDFVRAVDWWCGVCAADHGYHVQYRFIHGVDHGDRHRG